jgi:hypothetical protein
MEALTSSWLWVEIDGSKEHKTVQVRVVYFELLAWTRLQF